MARATGSLSTASLGAARRPRLAAVWLAAAIFAASLHVSAEAQQYYSDQPDMRAKANSGVAAVCVRNPASYATDKPRFTNYFTGYYFPAMTLYGPKDLEELGSLRYDLFSRYLWKTQDQNIQRDLTDLALQAVEKIFRQHDPPYHPAVQYNAMLILGMLDKQYAIDTGPNRRAPTPLPRANDLLVAAANAGADGKISPALLVAALIGLERHAQYHESFSPQATEAMAAVALKIISQDKPIQDVDKDVYAWIQWRAASVLANLGTVGPGGRNLAGLMKVIAGDGSLDNRCAAAGLLAKIHFEGATIDGQQAVSQLMKLALDVTQAEAKRADEFQTQSLGESGYGVVRHGRSRHRGDYEEDVTFERRGMATRLVGLRTGLQAIALIAPDAAKAHLANVTSAIDQVIEAAGDNDTIDLDVTKKVIQMASTVQAEVASAAPPAAPGGGHQPSP